MKLPFIFGILLLFTLSLAAQKQKQEGNMEKAGNLAEKYYRPNKKQVYKVIGNDSLEISIFKPKEHKVGANTPCIVFFHGGGYTSGSPSQFYAQCQHFADCGIVAFSAQYRLKNTPVECVKDAKSVIRWLRNNSKKLGIDPDRVAAGGGSAGGYLSAAAATLSSEFDEKGEDLSVSSKPNAVICLTIALDDTHGRGKDLLGDNWKKFIPACNIAKGIPPVLYVAGSADNRTPMEGVRKFEADVKAVGGRCDLIVYDKQPHGFYNYNEDNKFYPLVLRNIDEFLVSLGWLDPAITQVKEQEWMVDGKPRKALVYIPESAKTRSLPLIFAYHGRGGSMEMANERYKFSKYWPDAIVVYPQGLRNSGKLFGKEDPRAGWQMQTGQSGDRDVKFFDTMLSYFKENYRVDPGQVFLTGHSNGGYFTYVLWAMRGDVFAAVAPTAAATNTLILDQPGASLKGVLQPKTAFILSGEKDDLVKYEWQVETLRSVLELNGCDVKKGKKTSEYVTVYPSSKGTSVTTYIHPKGHGFPSEASPYVLEFFKNNIEKKK